jgi:hypothetical protein
MPEKKKATRKPEEKREAARVRDLPEKKKASDEQVEKVKGGKLYYPQPPRNT